MFPNRYSVRPRFSDDPDGGTFSIHDDQENVTAVLSIATKSYAEHIARGLNASELDDQE